MVPGPDGKSCLPTLLLLSPHPPGSEVSRFISQIGPVGSCVPGAGSGAGHYRGVPGVSSVSRDLGPGEG